MQIKIQVPMVILGTLETERKKTDVKLFTLINWCQKNLIQASNISDWKFFVGPRFSDPKMFLVPKNFLGQKNFSDPKIFWGPTQKLLQFKSILAQKNFEVKTLTQQIFLTWKSFEPKIFLDTKENLKPPKKFAPPPSLKGKPYILV